MGPLSDFMHYGDPWAVNFQVGDAGADISPGNELVVPRDIVARTPTGGSDATRRKEDSRLVVLGFHYDVVAIAEAGFDLLWADHWISPGDPPDGTTTEHYILRVRNADATNNQRLQGGTSFCFIPGPAGYITPGVTTPFDAAELVVIESAGGAISSGTINVWGIEAPGDWRVFKSYTGSPVDLGA